MKKFLFENRVFLTKNFLLCLLIFLIIFMASAYQLNPVIDVGREVYIPFRIFNGEVLYKDIFNIYGPLAYQINAFAYFIFKPEIFSLRILGSISAFTTLLTIYFILKEIFSDFDKKIIIGMCFLPFCIGIMSFGTFNYTLPYSFSMTYGLTFCLLSVLFLIKFSKTQNISLKFAYFSAFFAGVALTCKYEFLTYFVFVFLFLLCSKKLKAKEIFFALLSLLVFPLLTFGVLFLQGMTVEDLIRTSKILKIMAKTESLQYLYKNFTGTYFNIAILFENIKNSFSIIFLACLGYFSVKIYSRDKFLSLVTAFFLLSGIFYVGSSGYSLFAMINAILFFVFIKKIFQNKPVFIFMIFGMLLSLKTFFSTNIEVYGTYTLPFLILALFCFVFKIDFSKNEAVKSVAKSAVCFLAVGIILFSINQAYKIFKNKTKPDSIVFAKNICSQIQTYPNIANALNDATKFLQNETKTTDKVVIMPESQFLNFTTKRAGDNLYDSLTPMYFETFGEENVIRHFKETKPEYFILTNRDTFDYGKSFICKDYALDFCKFVKSDYVKIKTVGKQTYKMEIYKRKNL